MTSLGNSWAEQDLDDLAKALTFAYKTQTTYKDPLDLADRLGGWRFVLEEDFTMEQVLYGLKVFMKKSTEMPVPANIIKILNPEPPRITEAEFVAAQKWQERNGYPIFSDAKDTIEAYNAQEFAKREAHVIENKKIAALVGDVSKRLTKGAMYEDRN